MTQRSRTELIVVHGTWTPPGLDVDAAMIRKWHTDPKERGGRGWADIGYHGVIKRDGTYEPGRDIRSVGAHVEGHVFLRNDDRNVVITWAHTEFGRFFAGLTGVRPPRAEVLPQVADAFASLFPR